MKSCYILGISCYYHDSAAALILDGEIIAASHEERFTRIKHDSNFPHRAINFCLNKANIELGQISYVVFYENHYMKFARLLENYHITAPFGLKSFLKSMPSWLTDKIWMEQQICKELGYKNKIFFCDHHMSHAASAFYPSPFKESAILTIDGVGEWSTTTYGIGVDNEVKLLKEIRFPNSVGLLYSAFTYYCGFKINSGEYKLMGLAPYGKPKYASLILDRLIDLKDDGSLSLNQEYFDYCGGLKMTNANFDKIFNGSARQPESPITQREMDIAASIQDVLNLIVSRMAKFVRDETNMKHLVMAGGVALNVVSTGHIARKRIFDDIWIQPASGDAGGALGCAMWMWYQKLSKHRKVSESDHMKGSFLGLSVENKSIEDDAILKDLGATWQTLGTHNLQKTIAKHINQGQIVAICRGKAEYGPRALGARSILADARNPEMQSNLNMKIKFREGFRPFAPLVLKEDAHNYFETAVDSPYMLFAFPITAKIRNNFKNSELKGFDSLKLSRSTIPAVTHIDYSARVQTIDKHRNPFIYGVLQDFKKLTGCSVLINTSFNVRGEPIVNTVEDAFRCFMATNIDCLVIGNRFLKKIDQSNLALSEEDRANWLKRFDLD